MTPKQSTSFNHAITRAARDGGRTPTPLRFVGPALILGALLAASSPAAAEEAQEEDLGLGSFYIGPYVGPALGVTGPRMGYTAGLDLSWRTPRFFHFDLELGFLHLLPRNVDSPATEGVVGDHEVTVTGLYAIPLTFEVGGRLERGRVILRASVAFGATVSIQTVESQGVDSSELIASFCLRPTLGLDVIMNDGAGLVRLDLSYLWQQAEFELTGNDRDVDSVLITLGYSWRAWP